jgi:hypothetical protein
MLQQRCERLLIRIGLDCIICCARDLRILNSNDSVTVIAHKATRVSIRGWGVRGQVARGVAIRQNPPKPFIFI